VKTGDVIEVDVDKRLLRLNVSEAELAARRASWKPPVQPFKRGFTKLYQAHVTQAHEGCDFDFLQGVDETPEPVIF
jgi:dihydroxyacid dehydratase/phosphogluconate dehydratase